MLNRVLQIIPGHPAFPISLQNLHNYRRTAGHNHIIARRNGIRTVHYHIHIAPVSDDQNSVSTLLL